MTGSRERMDSIVTTIEGEDAIEMSKIPVLICMLSPLLLANVFFSLIFE